MCRPWGRCGRNSAEIAARARCSSSGMFFVWTWCCRAGCGRLMATSAHGGGSVASAYANTDMRFAMMHCTRLLEHVRVLVSQGELLQSREHWYEGTTWCCV